MLVAHLNKRRKCFLGWHKYAYKYETKGHQGLFKVHRRKKNYVNKNVIN